MRPSLPPSNSSFDVVIVGGGVMGCATAVFLGLLGLEGRRVAVVERDPAYRACSTARSVGGVRHQFSTEENVRLSLFTSAFLRDLRRYLEVDGEIPSLEFKEAGYLFLASAAGADTLAALHRMQTGLGADNVLLAPQGLAARFPWLSTEDVAIGCLGVSGEGWLDPFALLQGFRRKAVSLGVSFFADTVCGFGRDGHRLDGVHLAGGSTLACGAVVDAAGPAAGRVAALAGIDLPVEGRKRQVFSFACPDPLPNCPLVVDPSGVYFRPEGRVFLCGLSPEEAADRTAEDGDFDVDHAQFEDEIWPLLAQRCPAFERLRPQNAWAGHYEVNTLDHNAVIGRHPEVDNFYAVAGFSGHGIQHAPGAGRAIAELIAFGGFRSIDLSRLGFERITLRRPLLEVGVV